MGYLGVIWQFEEIESIVILRNRRTAIDFLCFNDFLGRLSIVGSA